jgi:hypothetical protein
MHTDIEETLKINSFNHKQELISAITSIKEELDKLSKDDNSLNIKEPNLQSHNQESIAYTHHSIF